MLLDLKQPDLTGIKCCRELRRWYPKLLVAMHTDTPAHDGFEAAKRAGADVYVVRGITIARLITTLRRLRHHDDDCLCVAPADPIQASKVVRDPNTKREIEVMDFISQGWGYKQAADRFGCSASNIKKTVARAIRHLGARSRDHAIRLWLEGGRGVQKDTFPPADDSVRNFTHP